MQCYLDSFLKKSINDGTIDLSIAKEMLQVVNVYNEIYGGKK